MHQDSFSSFNQSYHWFAALSFSWPSSFHKLPSDVDVVINAQLLFCNIILRPFFPLLIEEVSYVRVLGRLRLKTNPAGRLLRTDLQLAASENAKCIRLVFEFQRVLPPCSSHLWTFPVPENKERKHAYVRIPRNPQQEKKTLCMNPQQQSKHLSLVDVLKGSLCSEFWVFCLQKQYSCGSETFLKKINNNFTRTRLIRDYCIIFAFHTADKVHYNRLVLVTLKLT